jgi:hypothetical protein
MRPADSGVEKTQVIVNLSDRPDGRPGIFGGCFLFYGYGRRQAFDDVHVRLIHLFQKLAGVGGKGFHVSALAFGVYGVKGQRRLPRPGQAGNDHQGISGDVGVYVFQVMFSGSAHDNVVQGLVYSGLLLAHLFYNLLKLDIFSSAWNCRPV